MVAEFKDILVLSDMQVGSIWGLWPSEYDMTDGTRRSQNKGQQYLWKTWLHLSHWLAEAQKRGDANIVSAVLNGDLIDGKQRLQEALESMTPNLVDQGRAFRICLDAFLAPLTPRPTLYSVQGCLTEGHRVLTADLRWRPVEDLAVGDAVLTMERDAVQGRYGRRWQVGVVTAHMPVTKETCEVILTDGTRFICTTDHPFLSYVLKTGTTTTWVEARRLKPGMRLARLLPPWKQRRSYDAGYLAGILDGEGSVQTQGSIEIGQRPGLVQERIEATLERMGHDFRTYVVKRDGMMNIHVLGGTRGAARLLGTVRPTRLVGKVVHRMGRARALEAVQVQSVKMLGLREVVGLSTSAGTYVADGFGHRNTEYHDQKSGTAVESLAEAIGAIPFERVGIGEYSGELLDLNVDGVVLNFLHGISATAGLYRAVAIDREALWSAIAGKEGKVPKADVIVRSHVHHFVHVEHESKHALITPCWQLQTRFMRRVSAYRMMPDIGAVVIRVWKEATFGGDRVSIYKFLYPLPARKAVPLTLPADASA